MQLTYILSGDPVPLARPRVTKWGVYDSQSVLRKSATLDLQLQHSFGVLLNGPLQLDVTFFMPLPASWSKKKKASQEEQPHVSRPDLDNLIKWVCDIAGGIIYADDCIISQINARKVYSLSPCTKFTLRELHNEANDQE